MESQKYAPSVFTSDDSGYQLDGQGTFFPLPSDAIPNGSGDVTGSFAAHAAVVFGDSRRSCRPGARASRRGAASRAPMACGSSSSTSLAVLFTA